MVLKFGEAALCILITSFKVNVLLAILEFNIALLLPQELVNNVINRKHVNLNFT